MLAQVKCEPDRVEVEGEAPRASSVVVPLFRGPDRDEHPYAAFAPGNLTKRELRERLIEVRGRTSERWIERRMAEDGLPYHKVDPSRKQSAVRFSWPRVQAWLAAYGEQVGGESWRNR